VELPRLLIDERASSFVEPCEFVRVLWVFAIGIDDGLSDLMSTVSFDKNLETKSYCV
jgi:hypothetical protein